MTPFLYPVISLTGGPYKPSPHTVAEFFNLGDAESFAMGENLYVGEPRYDRRTSGYRASDPYANAYREWLASLDETPLTEVHPDPFLNSRRAAA
jgi:hypothetical protein